MTEDRLDAIRRALPATLTSVYLNTGTCGPLPVVVDEAMRAALEVDLREGRIGVAAHDRRAAQRAAIRRLLAEFVGAGEDEIALTHHTGEGLNVVLSGMTWHPGDEVITTDAEHASLLLPLRILQQRYGVLTRVAATGDGAVGAAIASAFTARTRLVALSHVSYATGELFPLAEIVADAHARDVPVLVDGAQTVGAIPLDLSALGVDYYAMSGQKWLLGPEGTGALFVRRDRLDRLAQTFVGYLSIEEESSAAEFRPHAGARRFEVGGQDLGDLAGQAASIAWLTAVGREWAYGRIERLAAFARERLAAVPGVEVLTPHRHAGLVSFTVAGQPPSAVVAHLAADGIIVRTIVHPVCSRLSTGFFNTDEEIERVAARLSTLV